ncbi:MAG: glycosyltransferase family 4 protein [Candidatus Omnitrophica bacterium]|nr:glycosyltransferase family 4 protein [Candidatus Omnitrophota bacterium]
MKILLICHEFPPLGGGAGNAAMYLAKNLALEHEVTVLTSRFKNHKQRNEGLNIINLAVLRKHIDRTSPLELLSFTLSGVFYALAKFKRNKYDVCLAIHGIPSGWLAMFIWKVFKIPYIVSLRGGDVPGFLPESYDNLHRAVKFLTLKYWKNSQRLITNSQGLKDLANNTARKMNKDIEVIPNGIDCNFFRSDFQARDKNVIKMLFTGRITRQKGMEAFIKTLKQASGAIKQNFSLQIIGEGPLKVPLQNLSHELFQENTVSFGSWVEKNKLLHEYQGADIFILPSLYEGMSNSLLEAMACGCMVIATDIAGSNELVKDGKNGFLFKPGDSNKLKEILISVLNNDLDVIQSMGRESRAIAEGYNWSNVSKRYEAYLAASCIRSD